MTNLSIPLLELTPASFAPFGAIIRPPATPAGRSGLGWETWYGHASLPCPRPLAFGFVRTELRDVIVGEMERHPLTFEVLQPHDEDLIQPVAPPRDLENDAAVPSADDVRAFRVPVGTAIVMAAGTWHSPAFPVSRSTAYTFMCLEYLEPYDPEWIPFEDGRVVSVDVGAARGGFAQEGGARR